MELWGRHSAKLVTCVWVMATLFFMQLACAFLSVYRLDSPKQDAWGVRLIWNPFYSSVNEKVRALSASVRESERRLEFMTFAAERKKEAGKKLYSVQEKLNVRPFSLPLWLELISLQHETQANTNERLWAMEYALMLGGWNHVYRLHITRPCLLSPTNIFEGNPSLCEKLLASLPHESNAMNARDLGVSHDLLEKQLRVRLEQLEATRGLDGR